MDNHYYPYGMLMGESSNIIADSRGYYGLSFNPHLYDSKDYITTAGANVLDFTAPMYDPSTLLFQTQDPKATDYTPLNSHLYCGGDLVNRVDPNGMDWVEDKDGNIRWRKDINKDNYTTILSDGDTYRE